MVSFQCDACQDVVKKPKLDQHRARGCGAGFTCIDCSTSFPTPADWKGHTTCVSEAQKYQGSLYRGPKANGGGREHHAGFSSANGKFQGGRGGSWAARPPTRYQATGANGTPLGTPSRMSPVTTPTPPIETSKAKAPIPAEPTGENKAHKKRKLNVGIGQATEAPKSDDPNAQDELKAAETKDTKEKREKKGKKEKRDKPKKADAAISESTVNGSSEPHDEALPSSSGVDPAVGASEKKKSKKAKKEKRKAAGEIPQAQEESGRDVAVDSTINGDDTKEEKKEKKKKEKKKKHAEESPAAAGEAPMAVDAEPEEKKKSKKRKREAEEQVKKSKDATTGETENTKKNKKKKKDPAPEI